MRYHAAPFFAAPSTTPTTMTEPTASPSPVEAPVPPTFREAMAFWFRLGWISFGGPAGQIGILHQELVEKRRWISEGRFLHALSYCMLLPGPEAQQLATYLGWLLHRTRGGIVAGALFVLPALFILIGLSWVYVAFGETPLVSALFYGIKPAVTAIVALAAYRLGRRTLTHPALWAIAGLAFAALLFLALPFPALIAGAALAGYLGGRWRPSWFTPAPAKPRAADAPAHAPACIDDDTPTPPHAQFAWSKVIEVLLLGGLLWLIPMGMLSASFGWEHPLTQMGWFFTKAALLTFGGAYAVLPYVYQGAVVHYGWLRPSHMIDGLALGETTPGPLIMVVTFVGFVGGYLKAILGPDQLFLGGAVAACLVTWFTFLPSFIFILAGGPLVESTHGDLKFTAPLTAITAAVVGVILNLALFFAQHVFWPSGPGASFDYGSLVLAVGAGALLVWRGNVTLVIAGCAVAGALIRLLA